MRVTRDLRRRLWRAELLPASFSLATACRRGLDTRSSTTAFAFWRNRTPTACTSSPARATISPSASHKPLRRSQPCRRARALLTAKRSPATRMASRSSEMIRWRRHDKDVVLCAFDLLNSTARICARHRSRSASERLQSCCADRRPVSRLTSTMKAMVQLCSSTLSARL